MFKHASLDPVSEVKRFLIRVCGAFAVGTLLLAGSMTTAVALEKISVLDGLTACYTWCEKNNPAGNARNACMNNCRKYWYCNGKDAASYVLNCKYYSAGSATLTINPQTTTTSPTTVAPRTTIKR
jgi:hypothetical protein